MTYIRMIPDSEADTELKDLYAKYKAPWGGVDHILKIHGLLPHTLPPHVDLYKSVMFGKSPLTRRQREMIATVVSKTNRCLYCIRHHSDALLRLTNDRNLTNAIRDDYRAADILPEEKLMLAFAEELTRHPTQDFSASMSRLREIGFSDEALLHFVLIVGYFNFVNRIANGLGIELEKYWEEDGYSDPDLPMAHDNR